MDNKNGSIYVKCSIEKYNTLRPHWNCRMQSPEQVHKQQKIRIKTYIKILSKPSLAQEKLKTIFVINL